MDIYTILSSKPHNKHYLDRYHKFIQACCQVNSLKTKEELGYTENHHICPKADDLFPNYKNFRTNKWNKAILTARQHFIAHLMLWKTYGGSQTKAIYFMVEMNQENLKRSSVYATLREDWAKINPFNDTEFIKNCNLEKHGVDHNSKRQEIKQKISESHKGKVKSEEHRKNLSESKKGHVSALDENGNAIYVTSEEFKERNLQGATKGRSVYKDKDRNNFSLSIDDPRVISGEVISTMNDGRSNYININGDRVRVFKDDPRVLSGEYKHINANTIVINNGKSERRVTKDQLEEFTNCGWTTGGLPNEEKKTHIHKFINGSIKRKMINPDDIQKFIDDGWVKGRGDNGKKLKQIRCVTTNIVYDTVYDAINWLTLRGLTNPKPATIMDCCRKITKTAYKLQWEYA